MATNGYDYNNPYHHFLLVSLIITSCDLSINVKMFEESSVIVRDHIYSEFFSEGFIFTFGFGFSSGLTIPLLSGAGQVFRLRAGFRLVPNDLG